MTDRPIPDSTRRDEVPARPVLMADSRAWGLALPTVRLTPRVEVRSDDFGRRIEHISVVAEFGYPLEIQRLIDRVELASERGPIAEQYTAFFVLAAALLRRAHDISLMTACELLSVPEEELPRLVSEVMAIIAERAQGPADQSQGGPTS